MPLQTDEQKSVEGPEKYMELLRGRSIDLRGRLAGLDDVFGDGCAEPVAAYTSGDQLPQLGLGVCPCLPREAVRPLAVALQVELALTSELAVDQGMYVHVFSLLGAAGCGLLRRGSGAPVHVRCTRGAWVGRVG